MNTPKTRDTSNKLVPQSPIDGHAMMEELRNINERLTMDVKVLKEEMES
jgi:hypothetical protein